MNLEKAKSTECTFFRQIILEFEFAMFMKVIIQFV